MTTTASLRTYLKEVIGFSQNALGTERANAVIAEGLTDFDSFKSFDKDDMKSLCYTIRRPGGTIPNPIYVAPVDGEIAAMPENIHNPRVSIPVFCESRFVLAAYGSKIYATIGRDITPQSMSLEKAKQDHGMLTAIVRYKSRYITGDGKPLIISFSLRSSVAVNAIIGLPTIKAWQCIIDFTNEAMSSALLGLRFKLHSAPANAGLPGGFTFESSEFVCPLIAAMNSHNITAEVGAVPSVAIEDTSASIPTDS